MDKFCPPNSSDDLHHINPMAVYCNCTPTVPRSKRRTGGRGGWQPPVLTWWLSGRSSYLMGSTSYRLDTRLYPFKRFAKEKTPLKCRAGQTRQLSRQSDTVIRPKNCRLLHYSSIWCQIFILTPMGARIFLYYFSLNMFCMVEGAVFLKLARAQLC